MPGSINLTMAFFLILVAALLGHTSAQFSGVSVTATPAAPTATGTITQLQMDFTIGTEIAFGSVITITVANENVFVGTGVTLTAGADFTVIAVADAANGGGAFAGTPGATITDPQTLTITLDGANGFGVGAVSILISNAALLESPQTQSASADFTFTDASGSNAPAGTATGWVVGAAVVGSDPITVYNGVRTKFWIPADEFTALLNAPEVSILAKPLQGPKDLQWFETLSVTRPDGKSLVEVTRVLEQKVPRGPCFTGACGEQIDLVFGNETTVAEYAGSVLFSTKDGKVKGAVYKQPYHVARTHGKTEIEHVHIETPSISFNIYASHAGNEFPNDFAMQKKYVHLDFVITSSKVPPSTYSGVLPELWEVVPKSPEVHAMTVSPSEQPRLCTA